MRTLPRTLLLAVFMVLGATSSVYAQSPDSLVIGVRQAYQQLDYELAEERALAALASYDRLSNAQLVELHTTLALVNYAQNELASARRQFENALALQPDLRLDPVLVSPRILEFFEQIKREFQAPAQPQVLQPPDIRYVQLVDVQTAAAVRSLVVPGWGQIYKGQRTKGWALVGLWGAAASGAVITGIQRNQAHDELEENTDPDDTEQLQDRYDRWRRANTNFLIGAAGVWLYSYLDALLVRQPVFRYEAAQGLSISAYPALDAFHFQCRLRF